MTHRTKHRKPPKSIVALSQTIAIENVCGSWTVCFEDHDQTQNTIPAEIVCRPYRNGLTVIVLSDRQDLISDLESTARRLHYKGSRIRRCTMKDRFIADQCRPEDVLSLASIVSKIEGRQLAQVVPIISEDLGELGPSRKSKSFVSPMVFVCHLEEESTSC